MLGQLLEAFFAVLPVVHTAERIRRDQRRRFRKSLENFEYATYKTPAVAKRLHKYVDPCMKRYGDPGYCWRVAWHIYCKNVNPGYPGCSRRRR